MSSSSINRIKKCPRCKISTFSTIMWAGKINSLVSEIGSKTSLEKSNVHPTSRYCCTVLHFLSFKFSVFNICTIDSVEYLTHFLLHVVVLN